VKVLGKIKKELGVDPAVAMERLLRGGIKVLVRDLGIVQGRVSKVDKCHYIGAFPREGLLISLKKSTI